MNKNKTLDFVENAGREGADENSTVGVGDVSESSFFYFYFYFKVFEGKQSNDPEGGNKIVGETNVAFRDPVELYRNFVLLKKNDKMKRSDWETLQVIFNCFSKSGSWYLYCHVISPYCCPQLPDLFP